MTNLRSALQWSVAVALVPLMTVQQSFAWGAYGHRMLSRIATSHLPSDVPLFLRDKQAVETMEFLAPEPDHWRNKAEDELNATTTPEHFIDMEWADYADIDCTPSVDHCPANGKTLPRKRFDYVRALAKAQAAHPDIKMTPENVGLQPWQVDEVYERLKVGMREYRKAVADKTETKPLETAILFEAAWLGHYVEDGSQPLHVTMQYNGWTGPNPNGYNTEHKIHSQFETVYVTANIKPAEIDMIVGATKPKVLDDVFSDYLVYLRESNAQVEKLYQLEKTGAFTGDGTPEGRTFTDARLAAGAEELRDIIYTAWVRSADPIQEYKGPQ